MFKKINSYLLVFGIVLILFSSIYVPALSPPIRYTGLDKRLCADVRIIVNRINKDNQTYMLVSIIIYSLVDYSLDINVIEYPYMEVHYNDIPMINQSIITSNSSFTLKPHEIITLFNASILINRNVTLQIFSGVYKVSKQGISMGNALNYIIGGSIVYIEYSDKLTISTGPVIVLQSSHPNTGTSYITIPVNNTETRSEEILEETSHSTSSIMDNFTGTNEPNEPIVEASTAGSPSPTNSATETAYVPSSYTTYNSQDNISQKFWKKEDHPTINYDLVLAIITAIMILILAKAITYIMRRKT